MKIVSDTLKLKMVRDFRPNARKSELFPDHFEGEMVFEFEPKELAKLGKSQYGKDDWMKQAAEKWADDSLRSDWEYGRGGVKFQSKVQGNRVVVKAIVGEDDAWDLSDYGGPSYESLSLGKSLREAVKSVVRIGL